MNISSSVSGSPGPIDRVASVSNPTNSLNSNTTQKSVPAPMINSVNELKTAEMRGEQFTISDEQLVRAIDRAIKSMQGTATNLEFSVHEKTKMIAVKVLNSETGEIIREIPPEKTLDFVAKLWEMAGILIDEKR